MSYAIVRACGKQHRVAQGTRLCLDRLAVEVGGEVQFDEVLLLGGNGDARVGQPHVDGVTVKARVLGHRRGEKIRVFKRRKRKGFHKTIGHRQELTDVEIISIGG